MRKLVNGFNEVGLSLPYSLDGLTELSFVFNHTYGEEYQTVTAYVSSYDCYTGVAIVAVEIPTFEDGEYSVRVYDGDTLLYQGMYKLFSYEFIEIANEVVVGQIIYGDSSPFALLIENGNGILIENGDELEIEY